MIPETQHETVIILDFGSQYTQLIARRVREAGVYCEILPFNTPVERIIARRPKGLILSGSPSSVYQDGAPRPDAKLIESLESPLLGICYGLQILAFDMGGDVESSPNREFGYARLKVVDESSLLFKELPNEMDVWMSHGDQVTSVPHGFRVTALTDDALNAIEDNQRRIYGVQFHPEVAHTPLGAQVIRNFLFSICGCRGDWSPKAVIEEQVARIREAVGETGRVVCGLSGGVDSTVAAALVHQAIGERQTCIFVDNGLLRDGEFESTIALLRQQMKMNIAGVRAGEQFLSTLAGVTEPEEKRKLIGKVFIDVFEEEARRVGGVAFLVQGTLYPDVIESVSVRGPSAVIKSHHNVGGLPEKMNFELVEPLRQLFKDEVRQAGLQLGLPNEIVHRQPFPGPGLAVRILGEVTPERLRILRDADTIVVSEMKASDWYYRVWQSFPVLLPVRSVGVMGDQRTYENTISLRIVESQDGMTADWVRLPYEILARISSRIVNEVKGVNRVCYDISTKPPSTIEWE